MPSISQAKLVGHRQIVEVVNPRRGRQGHQVLSRYGR